MAEVTIPNKVRAFASAHRIDLSQVEAASDVLTFWDVFKYADGKDLADLALAALQANRKELEEFGSGRQHLSAASGHSSGAVSRVDVDRCPVNAVALNPLVDQVREASRVVGYSPPGGPAPTLFASGPEPAFTASGIPPSALREVPWQARHPMAAAATAQEAAAIQAEVNGRDGAETARMLFGDHPGNADYAQRVDDWRAGSMTNAQLARSTEGAALREIERRETEACAAFNTHIREYGAPPASADDEGVAAFVSGRVSVSNGRQPDGR